MPVQCTPLSPTEFAAYESAIRAGGRDPDHFKVQVFEAADLDEALALAAEASRACRGKVEVRPFEGAA